ncbi:hypothetical protein P3389_34060, partial [Vibrio parahaemolyticus]|nr:hypothetical protein [Vibrio parahaemolyticus]
YATASSVVFLITLFSKACISTVLPQSMTFLTLNVCFKLDFMSQLKREQKIILFSPFTAIHIFSDLRSHELYRKGRDFGTLYQAYTKLQPQGLKNKANTEKCQKLQFFEWPLEAGSRSESIYIDPRVKMPNFTAEINMFTAWYNNQFWPL